MSGPTLEKGFKTPEDELIIGITTDCKAEQEDPGYQCGDCNGVLATNVFDINRVGGNERSRDPNNGGDSVVAVYNAVRRRFCICFPCILEILWEKCIEERVPHSNRCPAKPDQACYDSILALSFPIEVIRWFI